MFESAPPEARSRFRIDPWAADYGSSLDVPEEEEGGTPADPFVETEAWTEGIRPRPSERPARIIFIDGVQRLEAWGRVEHGGRLIEAALASIAVGAAVCDGGSARFQEPQTARVLAIGEGASVDSLAVRVGAQTLLFEHEASQRTGRDGVFDALRKRRGEMERALASSLTARDSLVVLDGRLSFDPARHTPVVGFAKTIQRFYLEPPQRDLLPRLAAGERTPVFRIRYGETTRYSWFLRLPFTRPIHHALAGVVRLETPEIGKEAAVRLADLTAYHLPAFASLPQHDPRAPQNLLPVGGLERRLRHELGDALFIRRAIEDRLAREEVMPA